MKASTAPTHHLLHDVADRRRHEPGVARGNLQTDVGWAARSSATAASTLRVETTVLAPDSL
jgi:hypothetical protein